MERQEGIAAGVLEHSLEANRARMNAEFAEARVAQPSLDAEGFGRLLRSTVGPALEGVERADPAAVNAAALYLYHTALDLYRRELLGPSARYPALNEGWERLVPALGAQIAVAPRRVLGSMTNALYNLASEPLARPAEWIERMRMLAPLCAEVETLLAVGQVAAWLAGLAQYREGALALCRRLGEPVTRAVLGLQASAEGKGTRAPLEAILTRLEADPWFDPKSDPRAVATELRVVARVGGFRGFGGAFLAPPTVVAVGTKLFARAPAAEEGGQGSWLITADLYGATLHAQERGRGEGKLTPVKENLAGDFRLGGKGTIRKEELSLTLPELENVTSAAADETTLAVTTRLSHAVYLIGAVQR